ncbi:MAG: manganese efflux pump MntP family protein [Omnitrophica WOR_2 bacterium]
MEILTSLFIAVGLAMDAFAVSLGIGTTGQADNGRAKFRLSFHFGFFQSAMTLLGWLAGSTIAGLINGFDHWVALALLAYVGLNMVRSGLHPDHETYPSDPSRGRILMMLCVATSLDALAVGLSMAMIRAPILLPSITIGIVTLGLSLGGLLMGNRLGELFGKRMEIAGGLLLVGIGLRIVFTHI